MNKLYVFWCDSRDTLAHAKPSSSRRVYFVVSLWPMTSHYIFEIPIHPGKCRMPGRARANVNVLSPDIIWWFPGEIFSLFLRADPSQLPPTHPATHGTDQIPERRWCIFFKINNIAIWRLKTWFIWKKINEMCYIHSGQFKNICLFDI